MSPVKTGKINLIQFPLNIISPYNSAWQLQWSGRILSADMGTPEAARRNLAVARENGQILLWRTRTETEIIKKLIWHCRGKRSQRALARELGVSHQYVCKVLKQPAPAIVGTLPKFTDLFIERQAAMRSGASWKFHPAPEHPSLKQAESTLAAKRLPRTTVYHSSFTVPLPYWAWK